VRGESAWDLATISGFALGIAVAVIGVLLIAASARAPDLRNRGIGIAYLGFGLMAVSIGLVLIPRLGAKLSLFAGVPVVVLLLLFGAFFGVMAYRRLRS
jgi:ABC-type amino acid transport system permease subunit